MAGIWTEGFEPNDANHVALSPVSFLNRKTHGLAWIGSGDIVAVPELILPNGTLHVLSRRSGDSGTHGMSGVDGAYRGLAAECDYDAAASGTNEKGESSVSIVPIRERPRFHPDWEGLLRQFPRESRA